jgi:hypothetical protein
MGFRYPLCFSLRFQTVLFNMAIMKTTLTPNIIGAGNGFMTEAKTTATVIKLFHHLVHQGVKIY